MSELIKREDAINAVEMFFKDAYIEDADVHCTDMVHEINQIPAASPWHRVENELPNEYDTVIVCGRMKYDHEKDYEVFVDAAEYGPFDYAHDRWVTWNDWYEGQEEFKITHWMPLPDPPKEDV